jgi:hypothetical protein
VALPTATTSVRITFQRSSAAKGLLFSMPMVAFRPVMAGSLTPVGSD